MCLCIEGQKSIMRAGLPFQFPPERTCIPHTENDSAGYQSRLTVIFHSVEVETKDNDLSDVETNTYDWLGICFLRP